MQKIPFEDYPSTNTPIDGSNLNQLQDNVENSINSLKNDILEEFRPIILYNSTSGTTSNITLSDNISNYKKIKIYGKTNDNYITSNEFFIDNNNNVQIQISYTLNGNGIVYPCGTAYNINGTTMEYLYHYRTGIYQGQIGYSSGTNNFYVLKIEGFKQ